MAGEFVGPTGPVEIWQWGLKFGAIGEAPSNNVVEYTADATAVANLWTTHIAQLHNSHVRLSKVRLSQHVAGGLTAKTPDGAYDQGEWVGQKPGTAAGNIRFPLQTSLVVSLQSPRAGTAGKGRVFLPQIAAGMTDSYELQTTWTTLAANSFRDFLVALRPIVGDARVFSTKGGSSVINSVRVGSVPDTQRSRRGALREAYVTSNLPS